MKEADFVSGEKKGEKEGLPRLVDAPATTLERAQKEVALGKGGKNREAREMQKVGENQALPYFRSGEKEKKRGWGVPRLGKWEGADFLVRTPS